MTMKERTTEIEPRVCAREGCERTFKPKPKGMRQIYCGASCRVAVYHGSLPKDRLRQWQNDYYYRNQAACQERGRRGHRMRCECGRRKASVEAPMCDVCAGMPSVTQALK